MHSQSFDIQHLMIQKALLTGSVNSLSLTSTLSLMQLMTREATQEHSEGLDSDRILATAMETLHRSPVKKGLEESAWRVVLDCS